MRRLILGLIFVLAGAVGAQAQSTTVSGQVTDAGGQAWNNGTFTATFVPNPQFPVGPYTWTGGTLNTVISGSLSGTGSYSVSIPSNTAISPQGSQWQFQFVPNATSSPFTGAKTTITGATQTLNATPPDISINLTNPPGPFTTAYADDEITPPIPQGAEYFNTTSLLTRVWNGSAWNNQGFGSGGGGTITGSGTANRVAKFSTATNIVNSTITDNGATVTINNANGLISPTFNSPSTGTDNTAGIFNLGVADRISFRDPSNTITTFIQSATANINIPTGAFDLTGAPGVVGLFFGNGASGGIAASGLFRLLTTDSICWRNNAATADVCFAKNASDVFTSQAPISLLGSTSGSATLSVTATGGTLNLGSTNATVTAAGALTVTSCTGCTGAGTALSAITAATASNTIANGNNPQTWNWAQTTDAQDAMLFGETSAATGGTLTGGLANQAQVAVTTASNSTATPLEVVQGSITNTVATPLFQLETTWNNAGLVGEAILLNVTNTASAAGSRLLDLQVGGVSTFNVDKAGTTTLGNTVQNFVTTASTIYQGGQDVSANAVLGSATSRGADETGAGGATSAGGSVTIRGGNNAATNAASQGGSVEIIPGQSTGATQGLQGLLAISESYVKGGGTSTLWNLQCLVGTSAFTINDCGASPNTVLGVALAVNANTVLIHTIGSQTPINASAAVTVGDTVCAGVTAGQVTDSGGTAPCTVGFTVGTVLAVSGTWNLPISGNVTATTTLPIIQLARTQAVGTANGVAFSGITSGTNTTATMTVGVGALLNLNNNAAASLPALTMLGTLFTGGTGTTTFPFWYINPGNNTAPTTWNTAGTIIGVNAPSGFGGNFLDFRVNGGTNLLSVSNNGALTSVQAIAGLNLSAAAGGNIFFTGRSSIVSPADGILRFSNSAGTSFTRLDFGGTTNAFVALSSSGTALSQTLADGTNGGSFSANTYLTATNCAGVGTAASPSVVTCTAAAAGAFSCATNASAATCTINTTAVTANSEIFVVEVADEGARLGVTCNTSPTATPAVLLASKVAATSFTINMPTITTNPACFDYHIIN
jgi:hypothetical protein